MWSLERLKSRVSKKGNDVGRTSKKIHTIPLYSESAVICDLHLVFILTVHSSAPAMSAVNKEIQLSSDALPFRQGAKDAAEIRAECPQFRILIIGKANAGKTTILRKVCNAKLDAKPITYAGEGNEHRQADRQEPTKVFRILHSPSSCTHY